MPNDVEQESFAEPDIGNGDGPLPAVVGIGVSAASLSSLAALFASLTPDTHAAYLIVFGQADGLDIGNVLETLGRVSAFPVQLAEDGKRVAARHIYVGAPVSLVTIQDGRLRIRTAEEAEGHRGAFDSLLISLAEHAHERAVAIMLSGAGSEGSAGMVATKRYGGLSIAEGAEDHKLSDQGTSNPAAVADLHLPIDRIAHEITRYIRNLQPILREEEEEEDSDSFEAQVTQVATILRNATGHDFHGYKRGTFVRRIQRRIQVMQVEGGMDAYLERLRSDREEVQHLFQDLLIGVTQFFRDPAEFDVLARELPRLFERKEADDQFRVWVLGCATGEEAYSIAILLREQMARLDRPLDVQIFATDLDARALSLARAGRYADTIENHITPERLERWFVREGDTYCVTKELREMCIFSPHNITRDAPFSRIDVLSCRNLLIYLSTDLQNRVIPIFHFSLRPDGVLFLGSSENVTRHPKLFTPVDRKSRVFRRLETATRIIPDFPLTSRPPKGEPPALAFPSTSFEGRLPAALGRQATAVAERYAPAYVVVDPHGDVLHFSGRTGRYLEPSAGAASLSLPTLIHRDLRLDVRSALQRAVAESRRIEVPHLTISQDDQSFGVSLIVEPLSSGDVTALIVVFQDLGPMSGGVSTDGNRFNHDEHAQRLEAELRLTRDRLQTTIEELESTNEELKSSNEEYQSINEELQSANEEMETSKEELQSVNGELQTVNGELAHRVQELGRTNSDLKNLLESTQIATVFLDNDLRIRNFTPTATDIFHLLETDVGRPLDHVVSRVSYPELVEDVRRVLKTLVPVERQVGDETTGRHFAARVLPYRTVDNYISGAVVTFTDLTDVRRIEAALRESDARRIAMADAAPALVWETDKGGTTFVNQHYLDFFGASFDRLKGFGWADFVHPDDRDAYVAAYRSAFDNRERFEYEIRLLRANGEYRWTQSTGLPLGEDRFVGLCLDITESRRAEEEVRESERRQRALIEGIQQLVWRATKDGEWTWASPQWAEYTGQPEAESYGYGWLDAIHPDDREKARGFPAAEDEQIVDLEYRICRASDEGYRWFRTRATLVRDEHGAIIEWLGTSTDVDETRSLQKRQEVLVAELQHRVRNMLTVIRSVFRQTVDSGGELEDVADHFQGRLDALARTQVIVTRNAAGVADLQDLIRDELLSVGVSDGPKLKLVGPDVALPAKAAESIGLAIHELTTNALKYGALKVSNATLEISWAVNLRQGAERRLDIVWLEQGVPAVPTKPTREGFGRELIEEALPYRLGAETKLEFLGGGVRCSISVPISGGDEDGMRSED